MICNFNKDYRCSSINRTYLINSITIFFVRIWVPYHSKSCNPADSTTNTNKYEEEKENEKIMCLVFCVICHMSHMTCNMSPVTCPRATTFFNFSCNGSPRKFADTTEGSFMNERVKRGENSLAYLFEQLIFG